MSLNLSTLCKRNVKFRVLVETRFGGRWSVGGLFVAFLVAWVELVVSSLTDFVQKMLGSVEREVVIEF